MANIHHLLITGINEVSRQRIIDDPRILKLEVGFYSKFRHGYSTPDLILKGASLHDAALDAQQEMPPQPNANAIIVRDDHPEFAWLMLQVQANPTF